MARRNDQQEQLPLFGSKPIGPKANPPFDPDKIQELARKGIYIGTSSWKYRGWEGTIYRGGYTSEAEFQREALREYSQLFSCVGLDFTFYNWPTASQAAQLLNDTPDDFVFCPKVTNRISMARFPNHPSQGKWAGQENSDFFNPQKFTESFLNPMASLKGRVGTLIFELTELEESHLDKLEYFFANVPRDLPYGLELRSPALLNPDFYRRLAAWGVAPVFNSWTKMPMLREQLRVFLEADVEPSHLCVRALLRPGRTYEDAVKSFAPYDRLQEEFPEGRDDMVRLINYATERATKMYALVNNRFEGSAPHTIAAITKRV
jgi:uncharacterized protein YecE (DUF72 family)